jgi:effector-binding domain-containing protein
MTNRYHISQEISSMSKFEKGYKKIEEFVSKYNIITKDDNKITIAYSGEKIRH